MLVLQFGSSKSFLAVNTIEHVYILNEQEPCGSCCQGVSLSLFKTYTKDLRSHDYSVQTLMW